MGTAVPWPKCWLVLSVLMIINTEGNLAENGMEVEFDGLGPGENSTEIEESNYINLTVRQNDQNVFHIKISHQQNNLSVDLCKFILKPACEVSDSSNATSHCQCLNNLTVQFFKKASSTDSGLYTWKWRDGKTPEKQRDFFINIKRVIGTEVEFEGLGPGENSTEIEESNYINLTVYLTNQNLFQIKISQQQNNLTVDLCKFILNTTCEVSDSSIYATLHCQCLNNHTVQFIKKASSTDSGLYTWTWRDGQTPKNQRDIFINVKKRNTSTGSLFDDTATATTTTIIICISVSVVVVATAVVVFCLRAFPRRILSRRGTALEFVTGIKATVRYCLRLERGMTLTSEAQGHAP